MKRVFSVGRTTDMLGKEMMGTVLEAKRDGGTQDRRKHVSWCCHNGVMEDCVLWDGYVCIYCLERVQGPRTLLSSWVLNP
jgi:hypothetical protein